MAGLLFRVDLFAIDENAKGPWGAGAYTNGDAQIAFEIFLEAHGLSFEVGSKETAFDFNVHLVYSSSTWLYQHSNRILTALEGAVGASWAR
jgi:hypothetical protein